MPFEIFVIPGVIFLIIGFVKGLASFRKQSKQQ